MNPPKEMQTARKKIFISYSHDDKDFAERLAKALHEAGEEVWLDRWEILPGDSLIGKIFEEGLSHASAFIIVLSPSSVKSRWVREELDLATVRRIEGVTRVIPVIKENTEIPASLRSLMWLDMREDFDGGVRKIVDAVHGITAKPTGKGPVSISERFVESVAGLSKAASTVGLFVLRSSDPDSGFETALSAGALAEALATDAQTLNDAVDELEDEGLVKTLKLMGTGQYDFAQVEPTYVLYRVFSVYLAYDPDQDVRVTAAAVAAAGEIEAPRLADRTGLSPGRLNRSVAYLEDYGLADVIRVLGTAPYDFGQILATRRTRQFVGQV